MIGQFDQIINIYSATKTISTAGEAITTYTLFTKAYAKIEASGDESKQGEAIVLIPTLKITTHNISGLNSAMRIVYNGENYDIQQISIIQQRKYIEIKAVKEQI